LSQDRVDLIKNFFGGWRLQKRHYLVDFFVTSVPPINFQEFANYIFGKSLLDGLGGIPSDNCVRFYVFNYYRLRGQYATCANCDAAHNSAANSNPYIVFNDYVPFGCGMSMPSIDSACGKVVIVNVAKGKGCGPVAPVASPEKDCLIFGNGAEASYVKMGSFIPAS